MYKLTIPPLNRINGVGGIVKMLTSCAVNRGFEPLLGQTKDYEIGICCFSTKHEVLKCKKQERIICQLLTFFN
jgi:hypothetical protein